jgi:hypothetical protein
MIIKTSRILLLSVAYLFFLMVSAPPAEGHSCGCGYWNGSSCVCSGSCSNPCKDCVSDGSGSCECVCNEECCSKSHCPDCYNCINCECWYDCDPWEVCCNDECCNECCPDSCCGENQWCCTGEVCCNSGEVCCFSPESGFYCKPPCWDELTDSTTCSEDNEDDYKCDGCQQLSPPPCSTYRDYTGLDIHACHDGCPDDWNSSNEVCYELKECFAELKNNSWCEECEGENRCWPIIDPDPPGGDDCETVSACFTQMACDIIFMCFQCSSGGDTIETVRKNTCTCQ